MTIELTQDKLSRAKAALLAAQTAHKTDFSDTARFKVQDLLSLVHRVEKDIDILIAQGKWGSSGKFKTETFCK